MNCTNSIDRERETERDDCSLLSSQWFDILIYVDTALCGQGGKPLNTIPLILLPFSGKRENQARGERQRKKEHGIKPNLPGTTFPSLQLCLFPHLTRKHTHAHTHTRIHTHTHRHPSHISKWPKRLHHKGIESRTLVEPTSGQQYSTNAHTHNHTHTTTNTTPPLRYNNIAFHSPSPFPGPSPG